MSTNSTGHYPTTRENAMRAFDKLPAEARRALAEALQNYAPQPILTKHRRGYNANVLAALIAKSDARELAKREDQRSRGVGPYAVGGGRR